MDTRLTYQLKWAWGLTKSSRGQLLLYFLLELLAIVLSLLFVLWSKKAVDMAIVGEKSAMQQALWITGLSIGVALLSRTVSGWLNERTRMRLLINLQNKLINSQMMSTWNFVKRWHTGDIQVRINNDCQEVVNMVGKAFLSSVLTFIRLLASFVFLWSLDPMLALLVLGITPLFFFSKLYFRRLRRLNQQVKASESAFGKVVQENLRFRMSIRALGIQAVRLAKVENGQSRLYDLKLELLNFSTFSQGFMKVAINAGFLLTFVWGVSRLYMHEISFGTMTAFLQLVGRIQSPILVLIGFFPLFIRFRTATERVQEMLAVEQEEPVTEELLTDLKALRLEKLSFRYDDATIIDRLDAELLADRPTAIIGSSGKGKTTLIRLLLSLVKPDDGHIWIETNAGRKTLSAAHRVNIAYVPQGDKLFSGTIRENMLLDGKSLSEEKIQEALYLACAEFVYDLPNGLDTVIGESGYGLSEGQAQRIAIARACMRDCKIWLFDEVTSALDSSTAEQLIRRLVEASKGKIVVFVTHDLKLAQACSQTIYIK